MIGFQNLSTERLVLRELRLTDSDALFAFRSDPVGQRFNGEVMESRGEAALLIKQLNRAFDLGTHVHWAVVERGNLDRVIGLFGYANWSREHRRAEIGYCLHRDFWRRGLAYEALSAMIQHGFGPMDLNRICASVRDENAPSKRLLLKLNFKQESLLRDEFFENGNFCDEAQFALLKREYQATNL